MIRKELKPINFLGIKNESALSHLPNDAFLVSHKYCQKCSFAKPMIPQGDIFAPVLFVGKTFNVTVNDDLFFQSTMRALGLEKKDVLYIGALGCFLVKDLTEDEMYTAVERCFIWKQELLKRMLNLQYVILSGIQAYQLFYGYVERLTDYVGFVFESEIFGKKVQVIPMPSPIYLARNPDAAKKTKVVLAELRGQICLK